MLKNNPLALILLGASGLLLALVMAQITGWGRQPPPLSPTPVDLSALPALRVEPEQLEESSRPALLEAITARPLLNPDRQPEALEDDGETKPEAEAAPVTDLKARLTSVVIMPEDRYAIILDTQTNKRLTLSTGMPLEGAQGAWVLSAIEPRKVVFTAGEGKQAELELDVFNKSLPAGEIRKTKPTRPSGAPQTKQHGRIRESNNQQSRISAEEIRRKIAERRAQLRAQAAKRNNK